MCRALVKAFKKVVFFRPPARNQLSQIFKFYMSCSPAINQDVRIGQGLPQLIYDQTIYIYIYLRGGRMQSGFTWTTLFQGRQQEGKMGDCLSGQQVQAPQLREEVASINYVDIDSRVQWLSWFECCTATPSSYRR